MYSTYSKKENAHDEAGWCCAWKRFEPSEEAMDTSENPENGGENKENEEDQSKKSPPEPREAVITGGKWIYTFPITSCLGPKRQNVWPKINISTYSKETSVLCEFKC